MAPSAFAQYVWLDDHGAKQFSDVPPPSNVPENRILKQPNRANTDKAATNPESGVKNDNAPAAKGPLTTAEKDAEYAKKKKEKEEKDKKAADEATRAAQKADNCARAKTYLTTLNSGVRMTTTDNSGERAFLSDADKAKEVEKTQGLVNDCK